MIHFKKVDNDTYEGEYYGAKIKISRFKRKDWQIYLNGTPTLIRFDTQEQCESHVRKTIKQVERIN